MNYVEQLKSPNWQRKCLEIMNRDKFQCQCCGRRDKILSVHHHYYTGALAWEYPEQSLITLCEDCHKREEVSYPLEIVKLSAAAKAACIPSWVLSQLTNTLEYFFNNPSDAMRFITDMQREALRRSNMLSKERIIKMAKQIA